MEAKKRQQIVAGLVLIAVGLGLWALGSGDGLGRSAMFLLIGGAFLAAYFYRKEFGFLVPGCIMFGIGLGTLRGGALSDFRPSINLGLGIGFLGIFFIALAYERRAHWWPLIPGGFLVATSFVDLETLVVILKENWPLILVIVGAMIVLGAFTRPRKRGSGPSAP